MRRALGLLLALAAFAPACDGDDEPTEVIVRIEAQEGVARSLRRLKVEIEGLSEGAPGGTTSFTRELPYLIALSPRGGEAERRFRVTATALDDEGLFIAQARLVGRFVAGERRYVTLEIEDACIDVPACENDDETCHARPSKTAAHCVDAEIDPREFSTDESVPITTGTLIDRRDSPGDRDGGAAGDGMVGGGAGRAGTMEPAGGTGGRGGAGDGGAAGASAGAGAGGTPSVDCDAEPKACPPPLLEELAVTAGTTLPLDPGFDPDEEAYEVFLPLVFDRVDITATASDLLKLRIADRPASSKEPMTTEALPIGRTEIAVVVRNPMGDEKTYTLAITRGRQIRYLKANDSMQDGRFGTKVAISGDRITVSRDPKQESAAVYRFDNRSGGWEASVPAELAIPTGAQRFGFAIAMAGPVSVVGAPGNSDGAVFVYEEGEPEVPLLAPSAAFFGSSVAIAADTIAVGAPVARTLTIFGRSNAAWQPSGCCAEEAGSGVAGNGTAVAVSPDGNVVAVGAPDSSNAPSPGAVYVFRRSGAGEPWMEPSEPLTIANGPPGFGTSLALANDMLLIGAPDASQVYVYRWEDEELDWVRVSEPLHPNLAVPAAKFGASLAISGDFLVVGAPDESSGASGVLAEGAPQDSDFAGAGAAYVFEREGNTWTEFAFLKPNNPGANDHFGTSVAISDGVIVIGAPGEDSGEGVAADEGASDNTRPQSGAAYVFQ